MSKPPCPICGDPNAFPLWVGRQAPPGCAIDESALTGGPRTVQNVTECRLQMGRAWQAAQFRKLMPDAFDASGRMKSGQLARVVEAFGKAYPGKALVL